MTIRSLIVDDEQPARDELRYLLSRYNDIEFIGEADSAGKAITAIRAATPDLVFLDIQLLSPDEIIYCSYESNRILIHTRQESLPLYSITTMDRLADHLASAPFFRIHRAVLVHLDHIREFSPWFNGKYNLIMNDSQRTEITVSRTRVNAFKERLGIYACLSTHWLPFC